MQPWSSAEPRRKNVAEADKMSYHQINNQKRATLLDMEEGTAPRRGWNNKQDAVYQEQAEQLFEQQNDLLVDDLKRNVGLLKGLSKELGKRIRDDNKYLDGMQDDFGQTGGLMGGVLTALNNMANTGNSKHMCYLALFIVVIFFIVYFMIR